jgi:two-component system, sensor histidine kinase
VLPFAEKNLHSILLNLLSNAFKCRASSCREPEVRLQVYTTDSCYVLTVGDNGLGLTADQQPKPFGLFRRMHDHVEGTGIGLYIVKKILI